MAKKKKSTGSKSTFTNTILSIFGEQPFKPFNYKQIAKLLGVKDKTGKDFIDTILRELLADGKLREERPYRYVLSKEMLAEMGGKKQNNHWQSRYEKYRQSYIIPEDGGEDIFIGANNTGQALHQDVVRVVIFPRRKNRKNEGEIVEVLSRTKTDYVGVLALSRDFGFVVPDSQNMPMDIFVPNRRSTMPKMAIR